MGRSVEANRAIEATFKVLKDEPRTFPLSPMTLELSRRVLETAEVNPADLRTSSLHLPPILDSEHIAYILMRKINPACNLSARTLNPVPLSCTGREVDYLIEQLVPYKKDEKEEWVEARTAGNMADYLKKFPATSQEELGFYETHTTRHVHFQLEMYEDAAREIHRGFESAGGLKRQSYIERFGAPETVGK